MPRFQLRTLLLLIVLAGVVLTALVRPSLYWVAPLPVVAMVICVYGVSRAVLLPTERAFWLSFLAGLFAYSATIIGVRLFFFSYGDWDEKYNRFGEAIAWQLLHGKVPWTFDFNNAYQPHEYVCFILWLHVVFAILLSAVAAFVVQFLTRVPDRRR